MSIDIREPRAFEALDASSTLDDAETRRQLDPSGLAERIRDFPEQCRDAWRIASSLPAAQPATRVERVVVAGMGGSAIGGDIVAAYAQTRSPVRIAVHRGPWPIVADAGTLVVASSHSGETAEVLQAYASVADEATRVAITRGGRLAEEARARGDEVVTFEHGFEPRSALGYGVLLLIGVLRRYGVLEVSQQTVDAAIDECATQGAAWGVDVPWADNPAKRIAAGLQGRVPVFLGEGLLGPVARRWQNQVNENSKQWAFAVETPELTHNLIEGFGRPAGAPLAVATLETPAASGDGRLRADLIAQRLEQSAAEPVRIQVGEGEALAAMLATCHLGDWVSYYLALLNGVDPAPVPVLSWFKGALRSGAASSR